MELRWGPHGDRDDREDVMAPGLLGTDTPKGTKTLIQISKSSMTLRFDITGIFVLFIHILFVCVTIYRMVNTIFHRT